MTDAAYLEKLRLDREGAFLFRRRRHPDWTNNYTLYRDKVQLNRLTNRQSVNIPLMKTIIKTLLKDVDDAPLLYYQNLDNDEQAEVFFNESFKFYGEDNKLVIKDIVDKKQVMLFGRSFKIMNLVNGRFYHEVIDPQDMLVDRYVDPSDLDTARFIVRQHIYKPLASLRTNPWYNTDAVRRLQKHFAEGHGLIKAEANQLDFVEKQRRLLAMGVIDQMSPILGETIVELNEYLSKEWNEQEKCDEVIFTVVAEDMEVLFTAPLEKIIGETRDHYWQSHYPLTTWGDDTERTDFWSDGVADTIRPSNNILNVWFSQVVENRTLRNYGMQYYNSSMGEEGFSPQTFTPEPWGYYPIPAGEKNIQDVLMHVDVPDLTDNLEYINFVIQFCEKASAATSFQQGEEAPKQITLGEVQLLLKNAQERVRSMAIFYTQAWKDFGHKYIKFLEASADLLDPITIHKQGRLSKKMYKKVITPQHWMTDSGYKVDVQMKSEKLAQDSDDLQWLNASRSIMPTNQPLDNIYKKKLLENANLSSDEINEVMKYDKQMSEAAQQMMKGQLPQITPPNQEMNFKDMPPQGQQQMAAEVGIQLNGGQPNQQSPALPGQPGQLPAGKPQLPLIAPQAGMPAGAH